MNQCVVANGNITTYLGSRLKISAMDYGTILHIGIITNADIVHIAPDNCIEPNRAVVTHHHIAYDGCIFRNEAVFSPNGAFIFYWQDDRHVELLNYRLNEL